MKKHCNGCGKDKLVSKDSGKSDFWFKHGKPQARCKDCQKQYHIEHYKKNRKEYIRRAKTRNRIERKKIAKFIAEMKSVPCMDCNVSYPSYVMDFDHREPNLKSFNIGRSKTTKTLEKIKKEIEKCDIVCANCHRIRTHKE